jgi:hypothetical protein
LVSKPEDLVRRLCRRMVLPLLAILVVCYVEMQIMPSLLNNNHSPI